MSAIRRTAPYHEQAPAGVTVAVAILIRVEGRVGDAIDVGRWAHEIDATLLPLLGADVDAPVGVSIRATERSGKQITADLILDAALACAPNFERSADVRPARTVADFNVPPGAIAQ